MENTTLLLVEKEAASEPGAETPILFQGHQAQGSRADNISVPVPWGFQPGKKLCFSPKQSAAWQPERKVDVPSFSAQLLRQLRYIPQLYLTSCSKDLPFLRVEFSEFSEFL